jgi:hypothetical protein
MFYIIILALERLVNMFIFVEIKIVLKYLKINKL